MAWGYVMRGNRLLSIFLKALAFVAGFYGYLYFTPVQQVSQHPQKAASEPLPPKFESLHSQIDRDPSFHHPAPSGDPPRVPWPLVEANATRKDQGRVLPVIPSR